VGPPGKASALQSISAQTLLSAACRWHPNPPRGPPFPEEIGNCHPGRCRLDSDSAGTLFDGGLQPCLPAKQSPIESSNGKRRQLSSGCRIASRRSATSHAYAIFAAGDRVRKPRIRSSRPSYRRRSGTSLGDRHDHACLTTSAQCKSGPPWIEIDAIHSHNTAVSSLYAIRPNGCEHAALVETRKGSAIYPARAITVHLRGTKTQQCIRKAFTLGSTAYVFGQS